MHLPSQTYTLNSTLQQIFKIDISVPECKNNSSGTSGTEKYSAQHTSKWKPMEIRKSM